MRHSLLLELKNAPRFSEIEAKLQGDIGEIVDEIGELQKEEDNGYHLLRVP